MAYNNNSNKSTFIKKTGQEVIDNDYKVNYSALINTEDRLSSSMNDQDELVVVRKFDTSTITDSDYNHSTAPVLASEAWSCWTLPNENDSGSSMYTLDAISKEITFASTTDNGTFDWTPTQSDRTNTINLPGITGADTIYVLRKTFNLTKLVEFTSGSRISADNLNYIVDQLLFLAQESTDMMYNLQEWSPMIGQPNGLVTLDATGAIPSSYTNVSTGEGIQGKGITGDKVRINLADDSLVLSGEAIKVNTVDSLVSESTTQPLSAKQGKELKTSIDALSAGVVYKGTIDLHPDGASTAAPTSPSAGDTYDIIRSSGSGAFTMTNFNNLSLEAGDIIRYSGSTWVETAQASTIRSDGTIGLSADWNAGSHSITAKTEDPTDSSAKLASTAFVKSVDLADFADVTDYGSGTNNHVLKRVSGAWLSVSVGDSTNGFSLHDLKDVHTAASDGQFLKWNGTDGRWEGASTGASAKIAEPATGTNDGTTDDQSGLSTLLTAVGIAGGAASTSSVYGSADLLGRHFGVNSKIEMFTKNDVQVRHGKLNWTKADSDGTAANGTMLVCPTETNATTFLATTSVKTGDYELTVDDATNFYEGDLIQIYTTSTSSSNNSLGLRNGSHVLQFELHYIESKSSNTLRLRDPLLHDYAHGSDATNTTIRKLGSTANARQQPHDIIFEDMVFEDTLHLWETIGNSAVTFNQGTMGNQVIRVNRASSGLADNAKAAFTGLMIDGSPANANSKWATTPEWDWLNDKTMPVTFDKASATLRVADGDEPVTDGQEAKEFSFQNAAGLTKEYIITDLAQGGLTTGTVVAEGNSLGSTTAGASDVGKIAVGINCTGSKSTQNALLVQIKAAIEDSDAHGSTITVGDVPGSADGNQDLVLTQAVGGTAGNKTITENLDDLSVVNSFTGGDDANLNISFAGGDAGNFATSASGSADDTGTILGMFGASTGIHIENGYRILFKRCRFKGFAFGQVKLTGCSDVTFDGCTFEDMKWTGTEGNAVVLKQCKNISFTGCTFRNVSHGIAYDGTGGYTAVNGLSIENCKFIGVTSGVRDINFGVVWDVNVSNCSVDCVSFNPYRNYPIADPAICYPSTGMKFVGLKIDIDNYRCANQTKWDEVTPTETSAGDAITDYYGTGKGWSTRWLSNSYNSWANSSISDRRHPSTAYGLKIVTFGRFDLTTKESEELWSEWNSANPQKNACQAIKVTNSVIDAWLCGLHISTEIGQSSSATDVANQNITQGIRVGDNTINSMCNGITIYGGQNNNAGMENVYITNNEIELCASGTLARFPGVRKLQGLTGTSSDGDVVNCTSSSEYVEGPACPQYAHCIRVWCDIKGDYLTPSESSARVVRNDTISITDNTMVSHAVSPDAIRRRYETDLVRFNSLGYTSANASTSRHLVTPQEGRFIIWGRHVGGELFAQGHTFPAHAYYGQNPGKIRQNTNNLHVINNKFKSKGWGNNKGVATFFQQYAPYIKGATYNYNTIYRTTAYKVSAYYVPIGNSLMTQNYTFIKYFKYGAPNDSDGIYYGSEVVITFAQGKDNFVDSLGFGESPASAQDGGYEHQNFGWAYNHYQSTKNYNSASWMGLKDYFHNNFCGNNLTLLSERYDSYSAGHNYYHSAATAMPQS